MKTIYFNELFDTIIFFTNTQIRKEFNNKYYKKYELDFEELTNINEKNNLKNMILETIEITSYKMEIITMSIVIYYYLTNKLEHGFCSNIYDILNIQKDIRKEIIDFIDIIVICDKQWCVKLRKFCNGFL
jgi:hypothetical protein